MIEKVDSFKLYTGTVNCFEELSKKIYNVPKMFEGYHITLENSDKVYTLKEKLSKVGGEGYLFTLYETDKLCLKVITKLTQFKLEKIQKLITYDNKDENICMPIDVALYEGKPVGYIMKYVEGKDLIKLVRNRVTKTYPSFNRKVQIDMIVSILNQFKKLHDDNILVGDIKLENIMFDDNYNTYLVDMDSVQVDKYNCSLTTDGYDSPYVILSRKITSDNFSYFDKTPEKNAYLFTAYYTHKYRNFKIENYELSTLLFKFLMNDNNPYDEYYYPSSHHAKDENGNLDSEKVDEQTLQQKIDFNFLYDLKDSNKTLEYCRCKKIWSYLPIFIKKGFVDVFKNKEDYSVDEWLNIFKTYQDMLANGDIDKIAKENNALDYLKVIDDSILAPVDYTLFRSDKITIQTTFAVTGFSMNYVVSKLISETKNIKLKLQSLAISSKLKKDNFVQIKNYKFYLIYNIGILKKVKLIIYE